MSVQDYTLAKKHVDWLVGTNHMRALGDLAAGRVTCGGTLDTPFEVRVNYLNYGLKLFFLVLEDLLEGFVRL